MRQGGYHTIGYVAFAIIIIAFASYLITTSLRTSRIQMFKDGSGAKVERYADGSGNKMSGKEGFESGKEEFYDGSGNKMSGKEGFYDGSGNKMSGKEGFYDGSGNKMSGKEGFAEEQTAIPQIGKNTSGVKDAPGSTIDVTRPIDVQNASKNAKEGFDDNSDFHLDVGGTFLSAYKKLEPDQISAMTKDTRELIDTQRQLMSTLSQLKPLITDGREMIKTFGDYFGTDLKI